MTHTPRKICILPNDPLSAYAEKGEIKPRYYNPCNYFDEVHILSLCEKDVAPEHVQMLAGDARLHIHALGKLSLMRFPWFFRKVHQYVRTLQPDVIRAYNPRQSGALAVYAGQKAGIPTVLSIHLEYDAQRQHDKRLLLRLTKLLEQYALRHVDVTICVTNYLQQYAKKYGAKHCVTIYNRVYASQFAPTLPKESKHPCIILSVGRLDTQKYQECLIRAIHHLDVKLILIGKGELEGSLKNLTQELNIEHKVEFIPSVPNREIQRYYHQADIFALATHYEGFCIPILEAMASGLPIVASRIPPLQEILDTTGITVENTPVAFETALRTLRQDPDLRNNLSADALRRAELLDGTYMEQREQELYESLLTIKKSMSL